MAIDETATIDRATEGETLETEIDDTSTAIDALFCECGTLREPTGSDEMSCPGGCADSIQADEVGLTVELDQDERRELTVADGDELQDDDGLEYSRCKHCAACEQDQEVEAWVAQTRSADEPPTRQYTCRVCGNRWREHG